MIYQMNNKERKEWLRDKCLGIVYEDRMASLRAGGENKKQFRALFEYLMDKFAKGFISYDYEKTVIVDATGKIPGSVKTIGEAIKTWEDE